jgi:hypothetical protein
MKDGTIQEDTVVTKDDLGEFAHALSTNKALIENALEIEVRGDLEEKPIRQLNDVLTVVGLKISSVTKKRSKVAKSAYTTLTVKRLMRCEGRVIYERRLRPGQTSTRFMDGTRPISNIGRPTRTTD